jgi:uncharacterized repeat protein (TIGR01451 family)
MAQSRRSIFALLFLAGLSGLIVGCFGGTSNPSDFPWLWPTGDIIRTHAKPPGMGYFHDFDRHACRLEVRPLDCMVPVRGEQVLVATIFDDDGKPRRKRRVEWMIEGPGNIIEVDESGYLPGRGYKVDNKYAVSYTDFFSHTIKRGGENGNDDFNIEPGQTWCIITSAVEGLTTVTVWAPEIADHANNRVYVKTQWVDGRWSFPQAATVKAGTEFTFTTSVQRQTDHAPLSNYRVRYRILENGPAAALFASSIQRTGAPQEATVIADADGAARVAIAQPKAQFGTNRISVEILKPDSSAPGGFILVARSETKVDWQAPKLDLNVLAPKTAVLNQNFTVTYGVASAGSVPTQDLVVHAVVPPGLQVVSTTPKATVDGGELLWSLPALPGGKQHTLQVVYRPTKTGLVNTAADAKTTDNMQAHGLATIQITEAKLQATVQVPAQVIVGEKVAVQVTIVNPGSGPATNIHIKTQMDARLEVLDKSTAEPVIEQLAPGEKQTVTLVVTPKKPGAATFKVIATADGNVTAETAPQSLDVKNSDLKVEVHAPQRAYVNGEVTWTVRVFNPGDVTLQNVQVSATMPKEVTFARASDNGKFANGVVQWTLGTAVGKQWTDLQVVAVCNQLSSKSTLTASAAAEPVVQRNGQFQTVALVKPLQADSGAAASIEILGIPALQMDVSDSGDPVEQGKQVTYTIRVKNAGTLAAAKVVLTLQLPAQLRPNSANGPTKGQISGQTVTFAELASIPAGSTSVFTLNADALSPGTAKFVAELQSLSLTAPIRMEESTRVVPKAAGAPKSR